MAASKLNLACACAGLAALAMAGAARADVVVSAGYFDLPPIQGVNTNPLPNPWLGSPNTTFFGNTALAGSGDPDEAALMLFNNGPSPVTLGPGLTIGSIQAWDSFIGAGFSLGSGQSLILSGTTTTSLDGSDIGLSSPTVTLSLNGTSVSFADSGNVFHGFPNSDDETIPWTQIGDVAFGVSGVPEPSVWVSLIVGLFGIGGALRMARSRRPRAAFA